VERKLIDYQTHLNRLCPLLAFNFAMAFGANFMYSSYFQMMNHIEQLQDFSMLGPMHTILAGLKGLWCNIAYEGAKTIRECCGAAGFSTFSGISAVVDALSAYVTLEGDSVVMYLQTARSLLKSGQKVLTSGKPLNKMVEYIGDLKILIE
jgi:acyl-CoA oxidase